MKSFIEYIYEAAFNNNDFVKHKRAYLKNTISQIIQSKHVMLGKTNDDIKNIIVDDTVIKQLNLIDINTTTLDKLNEIFVQNSVPFKWKDIFKSNLYKGLSVDDSELTSTEMESCICLAFNTLNNTLNNNEKNMHTEAEKINEANPVNSTTSKKVYNFYIANKNKIDACAKVLFSVASDTDRFDKLENVSPVSNEWIKLGKYQQLKNEPNNTPKTDIISSSGKCKISIKKEIGARLMSGKQSEAIATIRTALYRTFGKKEVLANKQTKWTPELIAFEQLLDKKWVELHSNVGIGKLKQIKKKIDTGKIDFSTVNDEAKKAIEIISTGEKAIEIIKLKLEELFNSNQRFKNNLLYEAITGRCKFSGKMDSNENDKNKSIANYVLVWDIDNIENNKIYTISDYIKHLTQSNVKINLNFKSANGFSYMSLQILT